MAGNAWGPNALMARVRRLHFPHIGREALEPQRLLRGLRPMPLLLLLTWLLQRTDGVAQNARAETDLTRAIVLALGERGLHADPDNVQRGTRILFAAHYIERIGDRVTNIAEDVVFLASGEIEDLNP